MEHFIITIPPLVNEIKQDTFYKCSSLEEVNIPMLQKKSQLLNQLKKNKKFQFI